MLLEGIKPHSCATASPIPNGTGNGMELGPRRRSQVHFPKLGQSEAGRKDGEAVLETIVP